MTHCPGRFAGAQRNLLQGACLTADCFIRGKCSPRIIDAHDTVQLGFWSLLYWSLQYCIPIRPEEVADVASYQGGMIISGNIDISRLVDGMCKFLHL